MDDYKKSILGALTGVGLITLLGGALVVYTLIAAAGGPRASEAAAASGPAAPAPPSRANAASQSAPQNSDTAPPAESLGDPDAGQQVYIACSACHSPDGKGLPGLGKDLTASEFVAGLTDDELVAFIKVGRDPSDPANTTGVAMPPKGGNPALSDDDLYNVVAFIRTLHQ
ncbi:MAG: c-type cytochrome [Anaerolineae bacterium]